MKTIPRLALLSILILATCSENRIEHLSGTELLSISEQRSVKLSEYAGKPVLLEFWSTKCPPCILSLRRLNALQDKYAGKVQILYVNPLGDEASITAFLEKHEVRCEVLMDKGGKLYDKMGRPPLPTAALLNSQGELAWKGDLYYLSEANLRRLIEGKPLPEAGASATQGQMRFSISAAKEKDEAMISMTYDGEHDHTTATNFSLAQLMKNLLSRRYGVEVAEIMELGVPYGPLVNITMSKGGGLSLDTYLDAAIGSIQAMFAIDITVYEKGKSPRVLVDYSRMRCPEGYMMY